MAFFGFWWVVLHWEFFYSLVFVSETSILNHTGYLKNEYLQRTFHNYSDPAFWWWILLSFLLCVLLTFLMVWIIPRLVLFKAHKRQLGDNFEKH